MLQIKKQVQDDQCELLLANVCSPLLQPVAVLTDLVESWQLMWFEGSRLVSAAGSACSAVKAIQGLVRQVRTCICGAEWAVGEVFCFAVVSRMV